MKILFGAAAAVLGCGIAHAQSQVAIFGVVDASYSHGKGSRSDRSQLTSGAGQTSRLGFRGREDLGGGHWAGFWLESQLNTDNGTFTGTNTNNQASGAGPATAGAAGLTFSRRSTVSLGGQWGELRVGRDFTTHYYNRAESDPFVVGVGGSQVLTGTLAGITSTRASNILSYLTPSSLGGFFAQAQMYLGENGSVGTTSDDGNGYSLRVGYGREQLSAALSHGRTEYAAGDIVSTNVAVIYRFNWAKLSAGYFLDKNETASPFTGRGYTLGAIIPAGAAGEVKFGFSKYGSDAGAKPGARKLAVGYVHSLSKRTALYGTYAQVRNYGGLTASLNGSTTAANTRSSGYDLGVRHSF
jgi:predicted porin